MVPGWYGMTNVKWLSAITVVEEPFSGYQVATGYRVRQNEDEEGRPVTHMRTRSLMVPPGIPDFFTRERIVDRGPVEIHGRAWSGRAPIVRVEVSVDGGTTWSDARVERDPDHRWAWAGWSYRWEAARRRAMHALLQGDRRDGGDAAARARVEPRRLREQRRPAHPGRRALSVPPGGPAAPTVLRARRSLA